MTRLKRWSRYLIFSTTLVSFSLGYGDNEFVKKGEEEFKDVEVGNTEIEKVPRRLLEMPLKTGGVRLDFLFEVFDCILPRVGVQ